ncbi:MAG TPA: rod shape-determining protein RodA [Saprospiraceae bacterium]|nr:rod shape-determining protein RodA [Saprospiraceae bacterium]
MANPRLGKLDIVTTSLFFSLVILGWIMYYAVTYSPENTTSIFDLSRGLGKETLWVGSSIILFFLVQVLDARVWSGLAFVFYAIGILLLIGVLIFGSSIKGATSWYTFGGFSFQPSEFAKFGTALAMSATLSGPSDDMSNPKTRLIAFGLLALPVFLIMLQPDAGSALVFSSFFILFYRKGLNGTIYVIGFILVALFILSLIYPSYGILLVLLAAGLVFAVSRKDKKIWQEYAMIAAALVFGFYFFEYNWSIIPLALIMVRRVVLYIKNGNLKKLVFHFSTLLIAIGIVYGARYFYDHILEPHQQERINVWLNPSKCDPRGSLYNVLQSKMAIGSGGLAGRGFLNGELTQLNYVPEQSTDFIFCTIGEEQGFIGVTMTILIFLGLVLRLTFLAERQRHSFSKNYGYALAGILFFHFMINIGMTMGLFPIIGIPLPMVSYGGTSLMMFTLMISVMIKLDQSRQRTG